ncbi:MAG: MFS transporter [Pseudomonadales bacterium]|nr:MFS transporter [Pseudomonadales bacterium]
MSEAAHDPGLGTPTQSEAPTSQFGLLGTRRLAPLFVTQFFGAFNDNLFKQAFIVILTFSGLVAIEDTGIYVNLAAGLFILPFFLFSATAGTLADRFEKSRLIRFVKVGEIGVAALAGIALYLESVPVLFAVLFLSGVQSTFFGPLKYSILPQHLDSRELVGGNAMVQMGTFVAILLGTIAGGIIGGWDDVSLLLFVFVVAVAVLGYVASRWIPRAEPTKTDNLGWNPVVETWRLIGLARERKAVFLSILGVSWFWLLGSVILAQIPALVRDLSGGPRVVTLIMVVFTVAIAIGSLLCEKLSGHRVEIGLVPVGAAGVSLFGLDAYFAISAIAGGDAERTVIDFLRTDGVGRLLFDLTMMGIFTGLYVVPLQANIQTRTPNDRRARVIAANNVLNSLFMVAGAGFAIGWLLLDGSIPGLIAAMAVINAGVAVFIFQQVPEFTMRFLVWAISHTMYRVRHDGLHAIPDKGAAVLVCNHVSYMDACLLAGAVRRPIRFVMHQSIYRLPVLNFIFRTGRTVPILPEKEDPDVYETAFREIRDGLAAGDLFCVFPEGKLTLDGEIDRFRKGIERIVGETPVPVVPMALRGLWGSFFSREGKGAFRRGPGRFWSRVDIVVGEALAPEAVEADDVRERVLALRGTNR